jgi:hypothetical protein
VNSVVAGLQTSKLGFSVLCRIRPISYSNKIRNALAVLECVRVSVYILCIQLLCMFLVQNSSAEDNYGVKYNSEYSVISVS